MSDGDALLTAVLAAPADDLPRLVYADWLEENAEVETRSRSCSMCDRGKVNDKDGAGPVDYEEWDCQSCLGTGLITESRSPGRDRAEFIRLQIELHNKPCSAFMYSCHENGCGRCECSDPHYAPLRTRERELLGPVARTVPAPPGWILTVRDRPRHRLDQVINGVLVFRRGFVAEAIGPWEAFGRRFPPGGVVGEFLSTPFLRDLCRANPVERIRLFRTNDTGQDPDRFADWSETLLQSAKARC